MKRRIISLLLVVAMALSLTVPGIAMEAKAATSVPVSVSSATGEQGDTVTVYVSFGVSEETPVKCAQFKLSYDKDKLTLVDTIHASNAPKGLRMFYTETPGTVNWGWADTKSYTVGGEWAEIQFQINEDATGTVQLSLYDTLCAADSDVENYDLSITNGRITITGTTGGGTSSGNIGGGISGGSSGAGSIGVDNSKTDGEDTIILAPATVEKVKFTRKKAKIKVGKTFRFKAKTIGKSATVKFSVSKKKIGTINKKTGKFRAKKPGKVIVYAKAGGKTAKYKVKVVK